MYHSSSYRKRYSGWRKDISQYLETSTNSEHELSSSSLSSLSSLSSSKAKEGKGSKDAKDAKDSKDAKDTPRKQEKFFSSVSLVPSVPSVSTIPPPPPLLSTRFTHSNFNTNVPSSDSEEDDLHPVFETQRKSEQKQLSKIEHSSGALSKEENEKFEQKIRKGINDYFREAFDRCPTESLAKQVLRSLVLIDQQSLSTPTMIESLLPIVNSEKKEIAQSTKIEKSEKPEKSGDKMKFDVGSKESCSLDGVCGSLASQGDSLLVGITGDTQVEKVLPKEQVKL